MASRKERKRRRLRESRSRSAALGLERMAITLPVEDEDPERPWPPFSVETLWVEPLGDSRYRVDNIPFFAKPLAVDDIVSGRPGAEDEDVVWFAERLESAGHSTMRIIITGAGEAEILQQIVDLGASYEKSDWVVAIDLPDRDTLNRVHAYLRAKRQAEEVDFEEACLPADFFDITLIRRVKVFPDYHRIYIEDLETTDGAESNEAPCSSTSHSILVSTITADDAIATGTNVEVNVYTGTDTAELGENIFSGVLKLDSGHLAVGNVEGPEATIALEVDEVYLQVFVDTPSQARVVNVLIQPRA